MFFSKKFSLNKKEVLNKCFAAMQMNSKIVHEIDLCMQKINDKPNIHTENTIK